MVIVFTMSCKEETTGRKCFKIEAIEGFYDATGRKYLCIPFDVRDFRPSVFIPGPFAERAQRIRITIEEL